MMISEKSSSALMKSYELTFVIRIIFKNDRREVILEVKVEIVFINEKHLFLDNFDIQRIDFFYRVFLEENVLSMDLSLSKKKITLIQIGKIFVFEIIRTHPLELSVLN